MKDAMGETTFTIIVIVAAGLIIAFVMSFIPNITKKIESTWKNKITYNVNAVATDGMNVGDYTFTI